MARVLPYSSAKSRIENNQQEIKRLLQLAEWEEGSKQAPTVVKTARKALDAANAEIKALEIKQTKVSEKLEALQESQSNELAQAKAKEKKAAAQYAAALAAGDEPEETRTKGVLRAVSEALESFKRGNSGTTAVIQALNTELETIAERIELAKQEAKKARHNMLEAARYLWAARLEKAVHELTQIAAHVNATEKALGWGRSMGDICLPILSATGTRWLRERAVREISAELSIEQLIAA